MPETTLEGGGAAGRAGAGLLLLLVLLAGAGATTTAVGCRSPVSLSEGGKDGGKGKKAAKNHTHPDHFPASGSDVHPLLHVVHRTTRNRTIGKNVPVLVRYGDFHEFGGHADEGRHPHPENCAGAANGDGQGDAGDIAGTDKPPSQWMQVNCRKSGCWQRLRSVFLYWPRFHYEGVITGSNNQSGDNRAEDFYSLPFFLFK